ncbi:RNA polymerase II subunit A C-terminal domain phosphatase SSU72 like protein 3-like [Odocoileus virginianus]|uniref:RNA polymerase II subunit A C-terminal domain phosphatase SSU72 n=1 Tax=Odocoileus virginianus TaxID=9874 RepID=A0ABM4HD47_ODOVR
MSGLWGAVSRVRLPRPAPNQPGVCYVQLHIRRGAITFPVKTENTTKGMESYKSQGKYEKIKSHPERLQGYRDPWMSSSPVRRESVTGGGRPVCQRRGDLPACARDQRGHGGHPGGVDMGDTLEAATLGAFILCERCQGLQQAEGMESSLAELLQAAKEKTGRCFLHTICFC